MVRTRLLVIASCAAIAFAATIVALPPSGSAPLGKSLCSELSSGSDLWEHRCARRALEATGRSGHRSHRERLEPVARLAEDDVLVRPRLPTARQRGVRPDHPRQRRHLHRGPGAVIDGQKSTTTRSRTRRPRDHRISHHRELRVARGQQQPRRGQP